jgi:hypothetical protein
MSYEYHFVITPVPKSKQDPKKWKKNMFNKKQLFGEPYITVAE